METRQGSPVMWLVAVLVLVTGLGLFFAAISVPFTMGSGMMGMMGMMGWGATFLIVPAVLVVLAILAAWGLFAPQRSSILSPSTYSPPPTSAVEILNARYARGEISRDEYLRVRDDLEGRTH